HRHHAAIPVLNILTPLGDRARIAMRRFDLTCGRLHGDISIVITRRWRRRWRDAHRWRGDGGLLAGRRRLRLLCRRRWDIRWRRRPRRCRGNWFGLTARGVAARWLEVRATRQSNQGGGCRVASEHHVLPQLVPP